MASSIYWGCCESGSVSEAFRCCSTCKKAYHYKCLFATERKDSTIESEQPWKCPLCLSKKPRGIANDSTPVKPKDGCSSKKITDANVTKRSTKRAATSSPPSECFSSHILCADDVRKIVGEVIDSRFSELLGELKASMSHLLNIELRPIREEIKDIKNSLTFLSEQYEDLMKAQKDTATKVKSLEDDSQAIHSTMRIITSRIDEMEQRARTNNVEIQCVPESNNENLIKIINQLSTVVGCDIPENSIVGCTRTPKYNRSSPRPRAIVVQFATQNTRDRLLAACNKFNKMNHNNKLNTTHLKIGNAPLPIYVSEHLSPANKALHAAARIKSKELNYKKPDPSQWHKLSGDVFRTHAPRARNMRSLNETACAALLDDVRWDEPTSVASLAILALIDVLVIAGNCLVIAAVLCSSKLRSVTNLFIVSLAVADLLVGVAVLPFSATREVFQIWIFGDVWCSVWLAVDVWMCTASILNLCAISLDRYVAVTRPVSYPSIMSRKRAKALIAGLWVLSFVICFPPLVGWKDKKPEEAKLKEDWVLNPPCPWTCELTNDAGYVVYSALGSFYIPMFVMLFFYWRIYKAAVRTTKAINQGFRTTKGRGLGSRFDDNRLTLRIHRGRGSARPHGSPLSTASNHSTSTSLSASPERLRRHSSARRAHEKVKISVSYPSSEQICPAHENSRSPSRSPSPSLYAVHYERDGRELTESRLRVRPSHHLAPGPLYDDFDDKPRTRRMGKRNIKAQVKRFRMETKAAKTLGIIVGGFVFCWLPFFSVYVVRAFCGDCVTPIVFSVLFWLGYCNSAINPLIYALFSKDFRFAFKRIICKCFCGGGGKRRESGAEEVTRRRPPHSHSHSLEEESSLHNTSSDR